MSTRSLYGAGGYLHKEVNQSSADTALDDSLDLVVGTVGQVADSPTSVNEDLVVKRVDELGEDSEGRGDLQSGTDSYEQCNHAPAPTWVGETFLGRSCSESK